MDGSRPRPRILLAEADVIAAYAMEQEFADLGAEVRRASDGPTALAELAGPHLDTDLLVVSLELPAIGGADLIRRIRAGGGEWDLPILAVGGEVTQAEEAHLNAHGAAVVHHGAGLRVIGAEARRLLGERGWFEPAGLPS